MMSKKSNLAGSLATVAIAVLGGPLSIVQATLGEIVKIAQARYDENEQLRQIHRQIAKAVTEGANSENFSPADIALGLELAGETVGYFGVSLDRLAELEFDPELAAKEVVDSAQKEDRRWGSEDHYAVVVHGIEVTYKALIKQLRASDGTAISSFLTLRSSIDDHAVRAENKMNSVENQLKALADVQTGAGTVSDVMIYLRARIREWDLSAWDHDLKASAVERTLRVREKGGTLAVAPILLSGTAPADDQMLVVLGGPGAGKTWLTRRYAREAAHKALSMLEHGAGLDEVELPLLTTWKQWAETAGSSMHSLAASSFASGLGHSEIGGADTRRRLERTFLHLETRVLIIVDSLDEAADLAAQEPRFRELQGLPEKWRVVITSRSAAWDKVIRRGLGNKPTRVVELTELSYPMDVEAFIHDWFREPAIAGRADTLIREIRNRAELIEASTVPLILTFYCLLAEDPESTTAPLPTRRRELYRRLVRRLLLGSWTANHPGPDAAPELAYCEELLRGWAWETIRNRDIPYYRFGKWEGSFTQSNTIRQAERRAIDHITPKTAVDDEGNVTRRFIHHTFLEHFVAEYFATMDTRTAAELLLPNLNGYYWQVAAPAAIAAHNQQHKGGLLQELLSQSVGGISEELLLAIAQESEPEEWTQEHQELIHRCRENFVLSNPKLIARSAHWSMSNAKVRSPLIRAMAIADDPLRFRDFAETLSVLAPTAGERGRARGLVLQALATRRTDKERIQSFVETLLAFAPSIDERAEARDEVLLALATTGNLEYVEGLAKALSVLAPTADERARTHGQLLQALATAGTPWRTRVLVEALSALEPTVDERRTPDGALP